jgi:uncharacterized membrane protein
LLRGLVIVLMALDHVRDFFGPVPYLPENLGRASAGLFLTRWVTHFCAPVFVLLAGLGAALLEARGRSRAEVCRFLWTRGLWLIVVELTVVNLSWLLVYYSNILILQVIWILGVSMVALAGMIWLPRWAIATLSLILIVGHNLLDGVQPSDLGTWAHLWGVLHARHYIPLAPGFGLFIIYPLIPWIGVMAMGYLAGGLYRMEPDRRRRWLSGLGAALTIAFVVLRLFNVYGDPQPWAVQERGPLFTFLSFLNTTKYPASLLFLLMTLGPALWILPRLEAAGGRLARFFVLFGRVPFFFYVIHLPLVHLLATAWSQWRYGSAGWWFSLAQPWPASYVPTLGSTYAAWILIVLMLFPACVWFNGLKRRSRHPFLRYL